MLTANYVRASIYLLMGIQQLKSLQDKCQVIVTDGVALGHPCCGVFRCTNPLQNNRHRFCEAHYGNHNICAIADCTEAVEVDTKTCSIPAHQAMERLHVEKGKAAFTLTERLKRQQHFQYRSTQPDEDPNGEDIEEDDTWFEANIDTGDVDIFTVENPGTVAGGTAEEESGDAPCPAAKNELGNKKFKAQFARRRTHNEQTLVRPCGVIVARATFFGAEAISNVLVGCSCRLPPSRIAVCAYSRSY